VSGPVLCVIPFDDEADAIRGYLDTKCVWISTDLELPNPFIRR